MTTPNDLLFVAEVVAAVIVSAIPLAIVYYVYKHIANLAARTKSKLDDYLVVVSKWPLFITIFLLSVSTLLNYFSDKMRLPLPEYLSTGADYLMQAAIVLSITSVLVVIIQSAITRFGRRVAAGEADKETALVGLQKIITYIIWILAILIALSIIFPPSLPALLSLVSGMGFAAIVVGLAAQKVVGNWLSGLLIYFVRPFRLGDALLFRGDYGVVEEIKITHTIIRTWDNRRLVVPNSVFDSEVVVNYHLKDPRMIGSVFVDISYESNYELAKNLMIKIASEHPNVLPDMPPRVHLLEFGENGLKLRLIFMCKDQPTAFVTAAELRERIKKAFDENGIEIPYPRRYIISERSRTKPIATQEEEEKSLDPTFS
ncbi:MAG: mechanosensitive ion channel family protein [Thaumarchaeota archaeon]|jgi:small-conductance mechanosensitive channel|nr:mechanosensitive ion channel family protein [Nitrososphaerota archaeon]